ncbi:MAG: protein BatD [Tidjanibacter sp.]|nr:protein BatD [Tidjanibacter sp.]
MKKLFLTIVALVAFLFTAHCEEVSFEVNVPRVVAVGQPFGVEFSINATPKNFVAPSFEGFDVLAGPSTSKSSSVQFINGTMSQTVNHTYSYVLMCASEGEYTIGSASVKADGKEYNTPTITLKAVKERTSSEPSKGGDEQGGRGGQQSSVATLADDDVLIVASVDRTNVYKGQPILVTYKLYTRVAMNAEGQKMPSFAGFWTQRLNVDSNRWVREEYEGKLYDACPIAEYLIFPQQSGQMKVEPLEMSIVARLQVKSPRRARDPFADFFDVPQVQEVRRTIRSREIALNVKALPEGAPSSFGGAVGTFEMNVTPPADEIEANSAVSYVVKISGEGNLSMIQAPQIALPSSFEQYSVRSTESIQSTARGVSGYRQFEYPMIARAEGDFFIPALEFTYFNPRLQKYVTLTAPEYAIHVSPDSSAASGMPNATVVSGIDKESIRFLGSDIRFIHLGDSGLRRAGGVFLFSGNYFLIVALMIVLFVLLLVWLSRRLKEMRNQAMLKGKRANKVALARFRAAEKYMKEDNRRGFYEEMLRGLWGYLADKLNIPVADLTKENIRERLARKGVQSEDIENYVLLIGECEYAQYAPSGSGLLQDSYLRGVELISRLEAVINR